jgi:hypothetical protein
MEWGKMGHDRDRARGETETEIKGDIREGEWFVEEEEKACHRQIK